MSTNRSDRLRDAFRSLPDPPVPTADLARTALARASRRRRGQVLLGAAAAFAVATSITVPVVTLADHAPAGTSTTPRAPRYQVSSYLSLSTGRDERFHILDPATGRYTNDRAEVEGVSPDGSTLIRSRGSSTWVRKELLGFVSAGRLREPNVIRWVAHSDGQRPQWSPDGRTVLVETLDMSSVTKSGFEARIGGVYFIDVASATRQSEIRFAQPLRFDSARALQDYVTWGRNSGEIALWYRDPAALGDWVVRFLDRSGQVTETLRLRGLVHQVDPATQIGLGGSASGAGTLFSPDGRYLLTNTLGQVVDLRSMKVVTVAVPPEHLPSTPIWATWLDATHYQFLAGPAPGRSFVGVVDVADGKHGELRWSTIPVRPDETVLYVSVRDMGATGAAPGAGIRF